MRWAAGAAGDNQPARRWMTLYQLASLCQAFPAYRLSELRNSPDGRELMLALQLIDLAHRAQS